MTIKDNFDVPSSAQHLPVSTEPVFILFLASNDPGTNQPWCSDVRAALPGLNKLFSEPSSPIVHYAYVGAKEEYKGVASNRYRTGWNVACIPLLARYERVGDMVNEVNRLVEDELLDEKRVRALVGMSERVGLDQA
ncbi:hypothetical protein ACEQ8H_001402 [Pleosporales sp. CAS-2024a]